MRYWPMKILCRWGAADLQLLRSVISAMGGYSELIEENNLLQLLYPIGSADLAAVNRYCFDKGVTLNHLHLKKKSLEAKFFEFTNN